MKNEIPPLPTYPSSRFTFQGVSYEVRHTVIDNFIDTEVFADGQRLAVKASTSLADNWDFTLVSGGPTQIETIDREIDRSIRQGRPCGQPRKRFLRFGGPVRAERSTTGDRGLTRSES